MKAIFNQFISSFICTTALFVTICFSADHLCAQATVSLTVTGGSATTTCNDVFSGPDPKWAVDVEFAGWEHYLGNPFCFNPLPTTQFTQQITCLPDLPIINVCFKAYENDGILCNTNEQCLTEICEQFNVPYSGSIDYILNLPDNQPSGGFVNFTIATNGVLTDQGNDDMCGAIDLGELNNGQQLGDATQDVYNNYCADGQDEPSTSADGTGWQNNFSVWFTFTTSNDPGSIASILGLSDPQNTGEFLNLQMALYQSSTTDCTGDFDLVTSSWNNADPDELMVANCLAPDQTYYILVDGFIPPPTTRFYGLFGLQIKDEGIVEAPDQICDATALGVIPQGGQITTGMTLSNLCATGDDTDPQNSVFPANNSVWFRFQAPDSRHVTISAVSDQRLEDGGLDAVDIQLALFASEDGTCDGDFNEVGASYAADDINENLELSCLLPGETYYLLLNGGPEDRGGVFSVTIADAGYTPFVETIDPVICFGDTLQVGNIFLTDAGPISIPLVTDMGCDSLVEGTLTILPQNLVTIDSSICAGDEIEIANNFYNTTGTYTDIITAFNGCDSTIITNLDVAPMLNLTVNQTMEATGFQATGGAATANVSGGIPPYTYLWENNETSSTITDLLGGSNFCVTVTDAIGCSAEDCVLILFPSNIMVYVQDDLLNCPGDSDGTLSFQISNGAIPYNYNWENTDGSFSGDGVVDTEGGTTTLNGLPAGDYSFTITDAFGIKVASGTVLSPLPILTTLNETLCFGSSLPVGTASYVTDGAILEILTAANGCDSTINGFVNFRPLNEMLLTPTRCFGETITVGANVYATTGPIAEVLTDIHGCDSLVNGFLTIRDEIITEINPILCFGQSLLVGTAMYNSSGPILETLTSWQNCDSTVSGNLTILPAYEVVQNPVICEGDVFSIGDNIFHNTSGNYTDVLTSITGCDSTIFTNLTVNPSLTLNTMLTVEASAYQISDGIASVTANGGDGNYIYQWDNSADSEVVTNLTGGLTYCVTVTDGAGCEATDCILILFPSNIQANIENEMLNCFGDTNGLLNLTIFNGVIPYNFTWENSANGLNGTGVVTVEGGSANVENLPSGTYDFFITDAFGSTTATAMVVEPQPVFTNLEETICFGDSLLVGNNYYKNAGPIFESLNSFFGCDSTVTGLLNVRPFVSETVVETLCFGDSLQVGNIFYKNSGPVSAVLIDQFGCDSVVTGSLTILPEILATIDTAVCFGESFDIGDSNLQNAGTFTEVLIAQNGCDSIITINLTVLGNLSVTTSLDTEASGLGQANGTASALVTGGSGNISYQWSNGSTNPGITDLTGGQTYCVTVTDLDANCTAEDCVVVLFPVNILTNITHGVLACFGGNDGRLSFVVSNGQAPYNYVWTGDNGTAGNGVVADENGTGIIEDLSVGNYTITVSDIWGETILSGMVTQPELMVINELNNVSASCFGNCDGSLDIQVDGGTTPYTYNWFDGQNTAVVSELCAGTFQVTVTDANNCIATHNFIINEPIGFQAQIVNSQSVACFGEANGQAVVTTNGTPLFYQWDNGETSDEAVNLSAGLHQVTVTNFDGCTTVAEVFVAAPAAPMTAEIITIQSVSCSDSSDGIIGVQVIAATGNVTYEWSAGSTTPELENIPVGLYEITVTDLSGCTAIAAVELTTANQIIPQLLVQDITCLTGDNSGAIITDTIVGGAPPFLFSLDPEQGFSNIQSIGFLAAGAYDLYIEEMTGCQTVFPFVIAAPEELVVTLGEDEIIELGAAVDIEAISNSDNVIFKWEILDTSLCTNCTEFRDTPIFTQLYQVSATDTLTNCQAFDEKLVTVEKRRNVYIPNSFSPNGDGLNDLFRIATGEDIATVLSLKIFNRWGAQVYGIENIGPNELAGWDGKYGSSNSDIGIYVFVAEVLFKDGFRQTYRGDLTLMRQYFSY